VRGVYFAGEEGRGALSFERDLEGYLFTWFIF
jgi:hypothetical protein